MTLTINMSSAISEIAGDQNQQDNINTPTAEAAAEINYDNNNRMRLKRRHRSFVEKKAILLEVESDGARSVSRKYGIAPQTLREWRDSGILAMSDEQISECDRVGRKKKHRRRPTAELVSQVEQTLTQYQASPLIQRHGAVMIDMLELIYNAYPTFLESDPEDADIGSDRRKEERLRNWIRSYCKRHGVNTERGSIIIPQ